MTAGMAVMSWAVLTTPAAATNLPALMEPASLLPISVMGRVTASMAQMRQTACVSLLRRPALHINSCANQASALMPAGFATGRRTARTIVTKKAVVRHDINVTANTLTLISSNQKL